MQSLRDQLLKAGLVTEEQAAKAEARNKRGKSRRSRRGGRGRGKSPAGGQAIAAGKVAEPAGGKINLKEPEKLNFLQLIETHRLKSAYEGEVPFQFKLRDGTESKLLLDQNTSAALKSGQLAIVENAGADDHVIVNAAGVSDIKSADPEAVRYFNTN